MCCPQCSWWSIDGIYQSLVKLVYNQDVSTCVDASLLHGCGSIPKIGVDSISHPGLFVGSVRPPDWNVQPGARTHLAAIETQHAQ